MSETEAIHLLTKEYSLVLAATQEDFQAVKKLRNDIISHNYPELDPQEIEPYLFSQDDEQSFIYLLRHQTTNKYVGTVRIFFINGYTPIQQIPMQKDFHVTNIDYLVKNVPFCEISRGALIHNITDYKHYSQLKLRTMLTYGLMVATRINFILYPYTMVFSIMESSLHRILKRQRVNFEQIGEPVNHYGTRIPFAIERQKLLIETENTMGQITRYYLKELCKNPEALWKFVDNNPYLKRSDIHLDRICQLFKEYGDDVDISLLLEEAVNIEA
ncbi:hypothetical protein ACM66Z_07765 [Sulfurovum sp. ST-21]|uniref:GNAT family N-acetyltransferase n=1 Tax=Sulfurovum indicum TaxID=2779528 RepID=A0A7M1S2Q8_9BACT|nr:hypothetical protein [Sulfurovum indicum]QOR61342.1 hypothetical protein IMZ28_07760 [Sulfurovum indicum]